MAFLLLASMPARVPARRANDTGVIHQPRSTATVCWPSACLDRAFGSGSLAGPDVHWPGSANAVAPWLTSFHDRWIEAVRDLTDDDLSS
jgi:hypothetical protein